MERNQAARGVALVVAAAATAGMAVSGCGTARVHSRPSAQTIAQTVTAVVALPPRLGFGRAVDQRRTARRTGDTLIAATGGRAILAEELASTDPVFLTDCVRELGEDPARTLTFSIVGARSERVEASAAPVPRGLRRPHYKYADYLVRLDVRRADAPDVVIGSIETYATEHSRTPEVDPKGRPHGLQRAVDEAVVKAVQSFAPGLVPAAPAPLMPSLIESPAGGDNARASGALAAVDRLRKLQALYPERPANELASLASSNARFLVIDPGRLAALGVAAGDLVSGLGGRSLGSRASLARILARGSTPAMSIDREGSRFLVGQTLLAKRR
jgi:hypothetical protein